VPRAYLIPLVAAALSYAIVCATVFIFQRSLIYFPHASVVHDGEPGLALPIPQGSVRVTTVERHSRRAVVYFGGNAEDVSLTRPELAAAFPHDSLYLMHYRGYGGSDGAPSEQALRSDALALFDHASGRHAAIVVMGRSLGTGIAVWLASVRPASRVVLVTPFDSLLQLAQQRFPYLPVSWLLLDRFESGRFAPSVSAPTLLIVAEHDEIVPRTSSETLHARFRSGIAELKLIPLTDHNNVSASPEYGRILGELR
jgi:pimeloyl-ACP methyl ester carboxylesterase